MNPAVVEQLQQNGMLFVGHNDEGKRMEIMELQGTSACCIAFLLVGFFIIAGSTRVAEVSLSRSVH